MGVLFSAEVLPSQMTLAGIELRKQANKCSDLVRIRLAPGALTSLAPKHCLLGILTQDLGMTDSFKAQKISNRAASCLEVTYRQALNLWRL